MTVPGALLRPKITMTTDTITSVTGTLLRCILTKLRCSRDLGWSWVGRQSQLQTQSWGRGIQDSLLRGDRVCGDSEVGDCNHRCLMAVLQRVNIVSQKPAQ